MRLFLLIGCGISVFLSFLCLIGAFILSMMGYLIPIGNDPSPDFLGRCLVWFFLWIIIAVLCAITRPSE